MLARVDLLVTGVLAERLPLLEHVPSLGERVGVRVLGDVVVRDSVSFCEQIASTCRVARVICGYRYDLLSFYAFFHTLVSHFLCFLGSLYWVICFHCRYQEASNGIVRTSQIARVELGFVG